PFNSYMTNEILEESEKLLKKLDKIAKFGTAYKVYPEQETYNLMDELRALGNCMPDIQEPKNQDELMQAELKRRMIGEAVSLEKMLNGEYYEFDDVVSLYGIPESDITNLRMWLDANKEKTIEAIKRLYRTKDVKHFELGLPFDIPDIKKQVEGFASVHIKKYHKALGKMLQDSTKVGEYLRDIDAVLTLSNRSYFNTKTNTLAMAISAVCFMTENGNPCLRERAMVELYGHEGMGHALNQVITRKSKLPYFLKECSMLTTATEESLAQFYENSIFDDLRHSPETQRELEIEHKFEGIYMDQCDKRRLKEYRSRLVQYAITVLADKDLGNPEDSEVIKKKIDLVKEVSLSQSFPRRFIETHRNDFDSKGNLSPSLVSELRYCAQPVERALAEFAKQGIGYMREGWEKHRSIVDATLLTGFWTPIGFVDNARLRAKEYKK
ncbi:hypothetical protein KY317_01490, partial [Candidatus Woesearchaeota archaeon]|nr:hypothetical protein [Candidatus Woesearchaeota archaeon]